MNYNIRQTTLDAYELVQQDISKRQKEVYNKLKELGEATNAMLSFELSLPINCITPRVHELRAYGCVIASHVGKCPITHHNAFWWKVNRGRHL